MVTEFWDEERGGFFFTSNDHEELLVRTKDYTDNASPSGNSAAADVFLKLAKLVGDERYERFAVTVLQVDRSADRTLSAGIRSGAVGDRVLPRQGKRDSYHREKGQRFGERDLPGVPARQGSRVE